MSLQGAMLEGGPGLVRFKKLHMNFSLPFLKLSLGAQQIRVPGGGADMSLNTFEPPWEHLLCRTPSTGSLAWLHLFPCVGPRDVAFSDLPLD